MGVLLALGGAAFVLAGLISILIPLRFLGMRNRRQGVGVVIMGAAAIALGVNLLEQHVGGLGLTSRVEQGRTWATVLVPAEQNLVMAALGRGRRAFEAGENEMQKGAARPSRGQAICQALSGKFSVQNWVGRVVTLSSNSDGKGVLAVEIAPEARMGTLNTTFADFQRTLIESETALFRYVSGLSVGSWVKFSGQAFKSGGVDCLSERSLTLAGSMQSPDFIFRFTDVRALD